MEAQFTKDDLMNIYHAICVYTDINGHHETKESMMRWQAIKDKIYKMFQDAK